jgi:bifunctional non-homologous end joining protein LigD
VGTGFTHRMLTHLQDVLRPYARRTAPAPGIPREFARGAHWVEPLFVGEVAYRNWTPDGRLRHPSWRGLRPDKTPAQAVRDFAAADAVVKGLMVTPDGRWRVEVVSRHGVESFRIVHGDNVVEGLDLAGVEKVLAAQGIDLRSLRAGPAA